MDNKIILGVAALGVAGLYLAGKMPNAAAATGSVSTTVPTVGTVSIIPVDTAPVSSVPYARNDEADLLLSTRLPSEQFVPNSTSSTSPNGTVIMNGVTFNVFTSPSSQDGSLSAPFYVSKGWQGSGYYYFDDDNIETSTMCYSQNDLNTYNVALTGQNLESPFILL